LPQPGPPPHHHHPFLPEVWPTTQQPMPWWRKPVPGGPLALGSVVLCGGLAVEQMVEEIYELTTLTEAVEQSLRWGLRKPRFPPPPMPPEPPKRHDPPPRRPDPCREGYIQCYFNAVQHLLLRCCGPDPSSPAYEACAKKAVEWADQLCTRRMIDCRRRVTPIYIQPRWQLMDCSNVNSSFPR
jgi:hypothetical protein